jgi:AcrR family transcriptional regulator
MKLKRQYDMTARVAKAEATKARIRACAAELYAGRAIEDFTLEEVAARAETTVQTVLRMFGSKAELLSEALYEMADRGIGLKITPPGEIPAAIAAIFDVYETMGDHVIQRLNDESRLPALKPALDIGRNNHRSWVKKVFAPQLAQASGSELTQLLNALVAATDIYVWKLLRRDRGLGRNASQAVVQKLVEGVTQQEKSHGKDSLAELVRRREPAA